MRIPRAFFVAAAFFPAALLSAVAAPGCGRPDPPTFAVERSALLAVLRTMIMLDGELVLAETGEVSFVAVLDQRACAVSGTVTEYDDGRLVFEDCAITADASFDGTVRDGPTGVDFEGFTGRGPAGPFSLAGGYTTTDLGDSVELQLALSGTYPDEDRTVSFEMTGSVVHDRTTQTVTADLRFVADDRDGNPVELACAFTGASLSVLVSLFSGDQAFETLCPDPEGDIDARFELRNEHTDGMNIHIKRPGEPFEPSNRIGPGGSLGRTIPTQGGISLAWEAGRNGQVLAYVDCPPAARDVTLTVRWRAGLGAGELVCE